MQTVHRFDLRNSGENNNETMTDQKVIAVFIWEV